MAKQKHKFKEDMNIMVKKTIKKGITIQNRQIISKNKYDTKYINEV